MVHLLVERYFFTILKNAYCRASGEAKETVSGERLLLLLAISVRQ